MAASGSLHWEFALMSRHPEIRSTTVLCVRRNGKVVMGGDGQVTVTVTIDCVIYIKVTDPEKSIVQVWSFSRSSK